MKTIIRRSLIIVSLLATLGFAKPETINQNVIKQATYDKIIKISDELYSKTGISIVAHFIEHADGGVVAYEKNITANLRGSYVFLVFSAKDEKVELVVSDDLKNIIVKNEILSPFPGGPIIPILSAQDKNAVDSKFSAAALNGIADISDKIADSKGIKLESSIGSDSRYFIQGLRAVFYGIIFVALAVYFYRLYQRRKAQ